MLAVRTSWKKWRRCKNTSFNHYWCYRWNEACLMAQRMVGRVMLVWWQLETDLKRKVVFVFGIALLDTTFNLNYCNMESLARVYARISLSMVFLLLSGNCCWLTLTAVKANRRQKYTNKWTHFQENRIIGMKVGSVVYVIDSADYIIRYFKANLIVPVLRW